MFAPLRSLKELPPRLCTSAAAIWSTTKNELDAIGGTGLRLYFSLLQALIWLFVVMAVVMVGPVILNANGAMYDLSAGQHIHDGYLTLNGPTCAPASCPPSYQGWL